MTELRGERVLLRPLTEADAPELLRILLTPEVAAWWGPPDEGFPHDDDPTAVRFAILVGDRVAGLVQFGEEAEPDYRHAWVDLFLDPALHGRGFGTEAVTTLVHHLLDERGHHRVTIDPATANRPAIRSYEKAGFRPVGVMQAAWRDPRGVWHDVLLMELIAPGISR
jgi:aminoglycoside 6'-N-acetyltransferase